MCLNAHTPEKSISFAKHKHKQLNEINRKTAHTEYCISFVYLFISFISTLNRCVVVVPSCVFFFISSIPL